MLDALTGTLEGGRPLVSVTIGGFVPESEVAELLARTEKAHEGVSIGSYPFFKQGRVGANFVIRSTEEDKLDACLDDLASRLVGEGREVVRIGRDVLVLTRWAGELVHEEHQSSSSVPWTGLAMSLAAGMAFTAVSARIVEQRDF
jgi:hypothetical protein